VPIYLLHEGQALLREALHPIDLRNAVEAQNSISKNKNKSSYSFPKNVLNVFSKENVHPKPQGYPKYCATQNFRIAGFTSLRWGF
jgi:hypothetical protein